MQRATARLVKLLEPCVRHPELVFHVPMEPNGDKTRLLMQKGMGAKAGLPDWLVLAVSPGLAVELKVGKNNLSPAQRAFRDAWRASGRDFLVVRSLERFAAVCGVPRGYSTAASTRSTPLLNRCGSRSGRSGGAHLSRGGGTTLCPDQRNEGEAR